MKVHVVQCSSGIADPVVRYQKGAGGGDWVYFMGHFQ